MMYQNSKRMRAVAFILVFTMGILTGCKEHANEDEIANALNSNRSTEAKKSEDSSTNKSDDHIQYTIEGGKGASVKVDADVVKKDGNWPVYEIKKHDMDDEFIKNLADVVFDNGVYEYHKSFYACSKEELDQAQAWMDEVQGLYDDQDLIPYSLLYEKNMLEDAKNNFSPELVQQVPDNQYYVSVPASDEMKEGGINEHISCKFTGKVKGENWILSSLKLGSYQTVWLYPYFQHEYIYSLVNGGEYQSNLCSIDIEDGQKQADQCLADLGYGDYQLINTTKTFTRGSNKVAVMNGYVYTYAKAFNNMKTAYLEFFNPLGAYYDENNTPQEYITIYVDSFGVEQIAMMCHYELGEVIAEAPSLLDFNKIDQTVQNEIKKGIKNVSNVDMEITNVEMHYLAVADTNSKYSFVPAWIYHIDYPYGLGGYTTDICVNAIDGTVINDKVDLELPNYQQAN